MLGSNQVDGRMIHAPQKKRQSIEQKEGEWVEAKAEDSDSDNDASSHNIFGDSNFVMTEELKQKLGLS
jgi:hypothetical protein